MNRTIVTLALVCTALLVWERRLSNRLDQTRAQRSRVGELVSEQEREALTLAAIRLERDGQPTLTYGRVKGRWRCLDAFLAAVDVGALEQLVQGLLHAQGFVVSDSPGEAASYGIGGVTGIRLSLCGSRVLEDPGGDVQMAFDLGASVPGQGGAFVRIRGEREVWAVDVDPRATLTPPAPGLPPLVEPYVVPRDWEGWRSGLVEIVVQRSAGAGFVLQRRGAEISAEEMRQGRAPWVWILAPGPSERPAARLQSHALSLFVQRLPQVTLLDPRTRDERLGADPDRLILRAAGGQSLQLAFGQPNDGVVAVWNEVWGTLHGVPAEVRSLALPDVELFLEDSDRNPWDAWLQR